MVLKWPATYHMMKLSPRAVGFNSCSQSISMCLHYVPVGHPDHSDTEWLTTMYGITSYQITCTYYILSSQVVSLSLQSIIEVANFCAAMDTLIDQGAAASSLVAWWAAVWRVERSILHWGNVSSQLHLISPGCPRPNTWYRQNINTHWLSAGPTCCVGQNGCPTLCCVVAVVSHWSRIELHMVCNKL